MMFSSVQLFVVECLWICGNRDHFCHINFQTNVILQLVLQDAAQALVDFGLILNDPETGEF